MDQNNFSTGNFHQPETLAHPSDSLGNQQLIVGGSQIGALEYKVDLNGNLDLSVTNQKGKTVFDRL